MSMSSNSGLADTSMQVPPRSDIAPFQKARLSLTDAVQAAQQLHNGKTVEARFEMWDGQPAYFVRTCSKGGIWEGRINATTGRLIGQPQTFTLDQVTKELNQEAKDVRHIHTTLTEAINNAEQSQGGKAIMAEVLRGTDGKPDYDVDVVKNGQLRAAMVDAETGKVG